MPFWLITYRVPVVALRSVGGSETDPALCLVDGAGEVWGPDDGFDERGYIVLSVGDAGDRLYGAR